MDDIKFDHIYGKKLGLTSSGTLNLLGIDETIKTKGMYSTFQYIFSAKG